MLLVRVFPTVSSELNGILILPFLEMFGTQRGSIATQVKVPGKLYSFVSKGMGKSKEIKIKVNTKPTDLRRREYPLLLCPVSSNSLLLSSLYPTSFDSVPRLEKAEYVGVHRLRLSTHSGQDRLVHHLIEPPMGWQIDSSQHPEERRISIAETSTCIRSASGLSVPIADDRGGPALG